jgi:hypothetical protein
MESKNDEDSDKAKLFQSVSELYDTYKEDEYMNPKLQLYICNQLPTIFQNMKAEKMKRQIRIEEMTSEQDTFIQYFLVNNQYFYAANTNNFFLYDGLHYQLYSEDDILYHVLSSISKDKQLVSWKHKTKINVMKRIKENNLLSSIPDSSTIQDVLESLTKNLFHNRELVKYFLCILGDNLLKKENHLIHFIHVHAKNFLRNLNNISNLVVGLNLSQTFKHKHYEHDFNNFRIVQIENDVHFESNWNQILKTQAIDILCVSCYYSNRFSNSDNYALQHLNNSHVVKNIFAIKNTTPEILLETFISSYIDKKSTETDSCSPISWKNMQYLWKLYLDEQQIPSVIFMNQLKTMICENLSEYYDTTQDVFTNIYSHKLPIIENFLQFWENNIVLDEDESDFEIEELLTLLKRWNQLQNKHFSVSDKQLLDFITFYYPTIEIENDKYLCGIKCSLWDKQYDIHMAIENMRLENIARKENNNSLIINISVYEAYLYYCKFTSNTLLKLVASKSYFEKYIYDHYSIYLSENNFFKNEWFS